jgi:hypothetical protein
VRTAQVVTIAGTNLGRVATVFLVDHQLNVTLEVPAVFTQEHRRLTFVVPQWQGANLEVFLDVSGQVSTPSLLFSFAPPVFTVSQTRFPTAGGSRFQLVGQNFGSSPYVTIDGEQVLVAQVTVGGVVVVCPPETWNDTFIECFTPARQGQLVEVVVSVGFQRNDVATGDAGLASRISYLQPLVSPGSPGPWRGNTTGLTVVGFQAVGNASVPITAPLNVTITGSNFGLAGTVLFGTCCNISWNSPYMLEWDHSVIRFMLPPSAGANHNVTVVSGEGDEAQVAPCT